MGIIIGRKIGQLGNSLFLFAHCIAYAKEKNLSLLNPSFKEYVFYFKNISQKHIPSFNSTKTYNIKHSKFVLAVCNFLRILKNKLGINIPFFNVQNINSYEQSIELNETSVHQKKINILNGWGFRNYTALASNKKLIKEYFEPTTQIAHNIDSFMDFLRAKNTVIIGVHLRKGDYKNFEGGKYFFENQTYFNWMKEINNQLEKEKIIFVLLSNEILNLSFFKDLNCCLGLGTAIEDIYTLAKCDYILGPPSTFSGWASYYGSVPLLHLQNTNQKIEMNEFKIYGN